MFSGAWCAISTSPRALGLLLKKASKSVARSTTLQVTLRVLQPEPHRFVTRSICNGVQKAQVPSLNEHAQIHPLRIQGRPIDNVLQGLRAPIRLQTSSVTPMQSISIKGRGPLRFHPVREEISTARRKYERRHLHHER